MFVKSQRDWFWTGMVVICFRIGLLLLTRTSYHPDEYHQYQEPALWLAGLRGMESTESLLSWEWQSPYRIRSFTSLLTCSLSYKLLDLLDIRYQMIWTLWPRFLHVVWNTIADLCLFSFVKCATNDRMVAQMTLSFHLFSGFGMYTSSRSLSNVSEMNSWVICLALFHHLLSTPPSSTSNCIYRRFILVFIASNIVYSIFARPTSALLWVVMGLWLWGFASNVSSVAENVFMTRYFVWSNSEKYWFLRVCLWISAILVLIDSAIYGQLTCTPFQFIYVNVGKQAALYFGVSSWYWLFSEGLPVLLGLYLFVIVYIVLNLPFQEILYQVSKLSMFLRMWIFSSIFYAVALRIVTAHQEHRFLLPILPAIHFLLAYCTKLVFTKCGQHGYVSAIVVITMAMQLLVVVYLLQYHQAGTEGIYRSLAEHISSRIDSPDPDLVIFYTVLAPCFTFPGYAHLLPHNFYRASSKQRYQVQRLETLPCSLAPWETYTDEERSAYVGKMKRLLSRSHNQYNYILTFDGYLAENVSSFPILSALDREQWPRSDLIVADNTSIAKWLYLQNYTLVANISHAHMRYDYDDPILKYRALLYQTS